MADKKNVDAVIANCSCWNEQDRDTLNKLSDDQLVSIAQTGQTVVNAPTLPTPAVTPEPTAVTQPVAVPTPVAAPVANNNPFMGMTAEEYMAFAPPAVRSVIANAMQKEVEEKEQIVAKLLANVDEERKEALIKRFEPMTLAELRDFSALIVEPVTNSPFAIPRPNYRAAATATTNQSGNDDDDDILPLPVMNFSKQA